MYQYDKFTKEELLELVIKQDEELAKKKYGLVWDSEKEPEQVVLDCENNIPILERISEKEIRTNETDDNILIEGDNYHALTCLNYTHKGKIDVIYIDPPYNTGKEKEWIYNDKYIDENDGYRHSKWLNFMEKRLKLANNLLSEVGVIFVSIDNNESSQLKLLCDEIFNENNFIAQITREAIKGGSQSKHIRESHDYVLVYAKNKEQLEFSGHEQEGIILNLEDKKGKYAKGRELNKWGAGSRREDSPSMWYSIPGPNNEKVYPIRNDGSEGRWRLGKKKMFKKIEDDDVIFEKRDNGTYIAYEKIRDDSNKIKQFTTLFKDKYINAKGGDALKKIFNTSMSIFDYAKPVELIFDLLVMSNCTEDAIILDFFAGSGTTAHAVLELNKQLGGNRKFIICTNNELNGKGSNLVEKNEGENEEQFGVCQRVTYPRINNVIKGYKFTGKDKTLLFEKKLTFTQLKKIDKTLEEINKIIEENEEKYDQIKKEFKDNTIKIFGFKNIDGFKDGLGGNLQYFKTDLIPVDRIDNVGDKQRRELTYKAGEMIAIKENTFEEVETNEWYQIFENKDKSRKTAIYFREDTDEFKKLIKKIGDTPTTLYIFSYGRVDKKIFTYLGKNIVIDDIPEPILEIYKEINLTLKNK